MTVTIILMALAVYGTFLKLCHAFMHSLKSNQ